MRYCEVRQVGTGWAIVGKNDGRVIQSYATEAQARAECVPGVQLTPAQRAKRFGDADFAAAKNAGAHLARRNAELVARLDAGLPLSRSDAREARRLKRGAI